VTVKAGLLKGTLISPVVAAGQVIAGPAEIVIEQVAVAVTWLASFTWTVNAPVAVGVPVMAPVEALSDRPAGSAPVATEKV
jgi:hypothetical protein